MGVASAQTTPRALSPGATFALPRSCSRDAAENQTVEANRSIELDPALYSRVDHGADPFHSHRGLRYIGRKNHAPPSLSSQDRSLPFERKVSIELLDRHHLASNPRSELCVDLLDLSQARQEDQDITVILDQCPVNGGNDSLGERTLVRSL